MKRYVLFFVLSVMNGWWLASAMEQKENEQKFDETYYRDMNSLIEAWVLGTLKFCSIDNVKNGDLPVVIEYSDYEDANKIYTKILQEALVQLSTFYVSCGALLSIKYFGKAFQKEKTSEEKIAWLQKLEETHKYELQIFRLFDSSDIWYLAKMINSSDELKAQLVEHVNIVKKTQEMKELVDEDIKKALNFKNWPNKTTLNELISELITYIQVNKDHPFLDMDTRQKNASKHFRCSIV